MAFVIKRKKSKSTGENSQVLYAKDLRKSYGGRPALRGLSFELNAGRILGFLGPNGAGKTTAIRILTTILEPDSGSFRVAGIPSTFPEKIREKIGVLPESLGFPKNITALEYLIYFSQLYKRNKSEARARSLSLLTEVGLEQRVKSLISSFSHGMRQRLGIARALVNDPKVVFLDEPTLGLDPRGQKELLEMIVKVARGRKAGVILCSHDLPEVESICDDVLILNMGKVIAKGTVKDIIGQPRDTIRIKVPSRSLAYARQHLAKFKNLFKVTSGEKNGWLIIQFSDLTRPKSKEYSSLNNNILMVLINAKIPILGLETEGGRLQDVFLNLTEGVNK